MRYKYLGAEPTILIDFHISVSPGDENIEVERPIEHPLFVLQAEESIPQEEHVLQEQPITTESKGDDL